MSIHYKKGKDFERQVEQILIQNSIEYQKQKRIKGFGKRWLVDFYLPNPPTIIECKNIYGLNLRKHLENECVKFLDIHNRFFQMNFVLVFPGPQFTMASFARFCVKYNIKLTSPDMLLNNLGKKVREVNKQFGKLNTPKELAIKLIKSAGEEGITAKEITTKLGWHCKYVSNLLKPSDLVEYSIIKSVLRPRRYFTKESYERSKEFKLIQDLKLHYLNYSDDYFAEKYGVEFRRTKYLRTDILGLKKPEGGQHYQRKHFTYKLWKSQQRLVA